jgi:hypothetical protein
MNDIHHDRAGANLKPGHRNGRAQLGPPFTAAVAVNESMNGGTGGLGRWRANVLAVAAAWTAMPTAARGGDGGCSPCTALKRPRYG